MPGSWKGSTRRHRLPGDWASRRTRVLARDGGRCTWLDNNQRCPEPASEVDHIDRHSGDDLPNLRSLCRWHHSRKTSREGNASRRRLSSRRNPEPHPGYRLP